jgi:hypothetical protein
MREVLNDFNMTGPFGGLVAVAISYCDCTTELMIDYRNDDRVSRGLHNATEGM